MKDLHVLCVFTVLFASLRETSSNAQTITDPGFETPAQGDGKFSYHPAGSAWTFAGNAGLAGNGSAFTSGNPGAQQGTQVVFLQGAASVSQSVADWPGGRYVISFQLAQRASHSGKTDVQILIDGLAVGTVMTRGTVYVGYMLGPVAVAAGPHTLTFQALNSAGGDNTALIDAVSIIAATGELQMTMDIADMQARIDAARARVQSEIYELERLHALLTQDVFVTGATKPQRDQIQAMLWQIRRFSVP